MRVKSKGAVYLVGAGPGDAGLLTLRGAELLRRADVVVFDALANPELLRLAPATAELISRGHNMAMPQEEITATIIAMARNLKLEVLAEGVETERQLSFLRFHGCHSYQGYLFSRPVDAAEATALLRRHFGHEA